MNSPITMTAYVLITLTETEIMRQNIVSTYCVYMGVPDIYSTLNNNVLTSTS